jgi:protein ImuA
MTIPLLSPPGLAPRGTLALAGPLALARGRVHEGCGPARPMLAVLLLRGSTGPVIWIHPGWQAERLFPDGLCGHADPGRIVFASARRPEDLLWAAEEALRAGAAPLVVAELTAPPALTPVRRLQLAAEAGAVAAAHAGRPAPLGLLLTPEAGGAAGVDSRWHLAPRHAPQCRGWLLSRLRARADPPRQWSLTEIRGRIELADTGAETGAETGGRHGAATA